MKKNIKYVKDVLNRIKDDNKIKRDHLFYSIGVICVLFMFIREYNNKNEVIVEPIIEEVIVPIIKTRTETMTFKEKFRASRDYHGPNGRFLWNGKSYHCKYVEEMENYGK